MTQGKVAFCTLGCKVNQYDTEALWRLFESRGYEQVEFEALADVYVINTCTVTHEGDRKSRQMIRRAVRRSPEAVVAVTGCYAQMAPQEVLGIAGVDLVVGNQDRSAFVDLIERARDDRRPFAAVRPMLGQTEFEDFDVPAFADRARASLKIEDGCNHFCTFCIIPHARGLVRSRAPQSVLRQARRLAQAGYNEIVLTGIHTGGYGEDLDGFTFADLISALDAEPGLPRIRISSIEASELTDAVVEALARSTRICRHLHIPLQAGHEAVLRRMNRHYTLAHYADRLAAVRAALPGVALTTDVIVGFPGETDEQFDATESFVREQRFTRLHVFPYSRRTGTPAANFGGQVAAEVKHARVNRLLDLSTQLALEHAREHVGATLPVVFEDVEMCEGRLCAVGHADNYMRVAVVTSRAQGERMRGLLADVCITRAGADVSLGRKVSEEVHSSEHEFV
ncbi:MAG: tRNA (N(6)-L-threonylcarbamoyladenosine(37)-C(2))-methylthiotransferase MtaB [Firmicutes bacterium]|nr:tRNA (N(6)-L-threonylcarbamoyladenosine(37)-C(2))-methylthiotransferase MtaB [Bacillota bacterium]